MVIIKLTKNQTVLGIDFKADLLKDNLLFKICKLFCLEDIYMDIFGANSKLAERLSAKTPLIISPIDKSHGLAIKATAKEIPNIIEVLSGFDFDEMNIWDCYTNWEKYLKDKNTKMPFLTVKPIKVESDNKFYLNYNLIEGQQTEIICGLNYDSHELIAKLNDLLK